MSQARRDSESCEYIASERGHLILVAQAVRPSLEDLIAGITPENLHVAAFEKLVGAEAW